MKDIISDDINTILVEDGNWIRVNDKLWVRSQAPFPKRPPDWVLNEALAQQRRSRRWWSRFWRWSKLRLTLHTS